MSVIRLDSPAILVKITEYGTRLAKLNHIWRAARTYVAINGYKVIETYGVIGVAPFQKFTVSTWLGYLQVPHKTPIHFYEVFDNKFSLVAEWASAEQTNGGKLT